MYMHVNSYSYSHACTCDISILEWLREWVRVRVRAGARECNTPFLFSLVLQNVVNIFVFVGSVASYEYLTRLCKQFQTG